MFGVCSVAAGIIILSEKSNIGIGSRPNLCRLPLQYSTKPIIANARRIQSAIFHFG